MFKVLPVNFHTRVAIHTAGWLRYHWHTAAAGGTMQQSGAASDQQRGVSACCRHVLAWLPRLYNPLCSCRDYSVATACCVGQIRSSTVSRARWTGAVRVVRLQVFTRYITKKKTDVTGRVYAFVPNSKLYVSAKNWQNRMISDKDITRIKRVTFFLSHSVVTDGQASN